MLPQENTLDISKDPEMLAMFDSLDALNGFVKLHEAWLTVNEETWHSGELKKSLDGIFRYVNQLASYISMHHDDIDVQIEADFDQLKGKQFATVVKRTDEWKALRKWALIEPAYRDQSITVESICRCILAKTREFIQKV